MSTSRRQLRRQRKLQDAYDATDGEHQMQSPEKASVSSSGRDSQSDAFSSDGANQNNTRRKPKRRLIRRTEDFQNLSTNAHLDDGDSEVKVKKVKKRKKAGYLPQICNVTEEYDILQKKVQRKRKHKQAVAYHPEELSSENICSMPKNDTDTSVPSDCNLVQDNIEDETKVKRNDSKRRNRRRKKVQFNADACKQDTSTEHSDVKSSDVSNSKGRFSHLVGTSDSDSVVYTLRNGKKLETVGSSKAQNTTVLLKSVSDKSDDSVEFTFKKKRSRKVTQKSPEHKEEKSIITSGRKPKKSKEKSEKTLKNSEVFNAASLLDTTSNNDGQTRDAESAAFNRKVATPLAKHQKGHRTTGSLAGGALQGQKPKRSIIKTVPAESKETNENPTGQMIRRKSVQFHAGRLSDTPDKENSDKRRDTYELNKSITDISVLKSCVAKSNKSDEAHTPPTTTKHEVSDLTFTLKMETLELEQSVMASGKSTPQNKSDEKVRKKVSNTPYSRVTRRKKVEGIVKLIDDVSPPEDVAFPTTTDESSEEDRQNMNGMQTAETVSHLQDGNSTAKSILSPYTKKIRSLSQLDQSLSSFGVSSTPLPRREGTYTLLKEKSNSKSQLSTQKQHVSAQKGQSSVKKPPTRIKMPNFSLIHKKAFEKMEDIEQLQQRKAERAKLLLSGAKPVLGGSLQSPRNKNILKALNFGSEPLKPADAFESPKPLQKAPFDSPKIVRSALQNPTVIVRPTIRETNVKPCVKSTAKVIVQDNKTKYNASVPLSTGFTRYGFKTTSNTNKAATKEEQIKAVANKNNIVRNNVAGRRDVIKGVRSNRRFDLLMKMRNKT